MKSSAEYFIPVNIYTLDTPVLTIVNDEKLAFKEPLTFTKPIDVYKNNEKNIVDPYLAAIHSIPDILVRENIGKIVENYLKKIFLQLGRSYLQLLDINFVEVDIPFRYKLLFVLNEIKCMDLARSEYVTFDDEDGYDDENDGPDILSIEKLVLDDDVLCQIPLEERIIFRLKEDDSIVLFYKVLVERIISAEPNDVKFVAVDEWRNFLAEERY